MAIQPEINIEFRTTWVLLIIKLFCMFPNKWLLKLLNKAIIYRIYVNGKLSQEVSIEIEGL